MFKIPKWVKEHRIRTWNWFQTIQDQKNPTYIKLCSKGNYLNPNEYSGLGWSALALKLYHMLNFFSLDTKITKKEFANRIKSFQNNGNDQLGYFEDKKLLKKLDKWSFRKFKFKRDMNARRAETRQAIVALKCINEKPNFPLNFMFNDETQVRRFINELPWGTNPWHAGSHTSHLLIFLHTNSYFFKNLNFSILTEVIFNELNKLYKPDIGSWFTDNPPDYQKINAAMKIYSAYDFFDIEVPGAKKIIDYALKIILEEGACNHVDMMYVLHVASKSTKYRKKDIQNFAYEALNSIRNHIQPDGGMCYRLEGTQNNYYGAKVSKGIRGIGDLHGTKLFTWSLVIIADILNWRKELKWKLPIT